MTHRSRSLLFWTPRVLAIALIGFLSVFALDVFGEGLSAAATGRAFAVHLIPSAVLALALALAWRRGWIGTLLFGSAGLLYLLWVASRPRPPLAIKLLWCATIAGPAFVIAALFWVGSRQDRTRQG